MDQKKPLVLIIDDDDVFADTVGKRLAYEGFETARAGNGEDGLLMLRGMIAAGQLPAAILLDISMPGMNGVDVLEKLHAEEAYRNIPVAIVSNFGRNDDLSWAEHLGARKVINKSSVIPADLPDIVREMVKK